MRKVASSFRNFDSAKLTQVWRTSCLRIARRILRMHDTKLNGCRQRLLFARQLIPRKCSLCSQGRQTEKWRPKWTSLKLKFKLAIIVRLFFSQFFYLKIIQMRVIHYCIFCKPIKVTNNRAYSIAFSNKTWFWWLRWVEKNQDVWGFRSFPFVPITWLTLINTLVDTLHRLRWLGDKAETSRAFPRW